MVTAVQYKHIAIGGTFDHLHAGHIALLSKAIALTPQITLGLTTEAFTAKKPFARTIQPYNKRKEVLEQFLSQAHPKLKYSIVPLSDIYGPALTDPSMDAIMATAETVENTQKLNKARKQQGLKPLNIISVDLQKGKDRKIIRSTRIRGGEIKIDGEPQNYYLISKRSFILPSALRSTLRLPFGDIVTDTDSAIGQIKKHQPELLITVGDVVTRSFQQSALKPDLSIIDFKNERLALKKPPSLPHQYRNSPGTIARNPVLAISRAYRRILKNKTKEIIYILGEEDLLALPAILLAPLGSIVVYGLRDQGIVIVIVDDMKKDQISEIIKQFE